MYVNSCLIAAPALASRGSRHMLAYTEWRATKRALQAVRDETACLQDYLEGMPSAEKCPCAMTKVKRSLSCAVVLAIRRYSLPAL